MAKAKERGANAQADREIGLRPMDEIARGRPSLPRAARNVPRRYLAIRMLGEMPIPTTWSRFGSMLWASEIHIHEPWMVKMMQPFCRFCIVCQLSAWLFHVAR
jgi:hypothetical protein